MKAQFSDAVTVEAREAILIYENSNSMHGSKPAATATLHKIRDGLVLPGEPLSRLDLQRLSGELKPQEAERKPEPQWLPPELLALTPETLCFWSPAQRRAIWFRTNNAGLQKLSGKAVNHPPLVFHLHKEKWRVWALRQNERPTLQTPLYFAPYFNTYENGDICTGGSMPTKLLGVATIVPTLKGWFGSAFTHSNINGKRLTQHPTGHLGLWQAARKPRFNHAPYLLPTHQKLADVL